MIPPIFATFSCTVKPNPRRTFDPHNLAKVMQQPRRLNMQHASLLLHRSPRLHPHRSVSSATASSISTMKKQVGTTITIGRKTTDSPELLPEPTIDYISVPETEVPKPDRQIEPVVVTVWYHEASTSVEDVIFDCSSIPGFNPGDICRLEPIGRHKKPQRRLVFTIPRTSLSAKESKPNTSLTQNAPFTKKPPSQISLLSNPLQKLLDLPPRALMQICKLSDTSGVVAETVEVYLKDINLSRDSMWNLSATLVNTCVFVDKRLSYLETRCGTIRAIYRNGKKQASGYINDQTRIVFRSEGAHMTFLVQISREMWHFEENGEIMFHKLVNSLFPKLFRKWRSNADHHSISIVLFTSVDLTNIPWVSLGQGERPSDRRDYFRVVVDTVNVNQWDRIMGNLRIEFANFKRDIMLHKTEDSRKYIMEGQSLPAVKGNVLEAINLGIVHISDRFRDTDLKHTNNNLILITPGTGVFDVEYDLLLQTSRKMMNLDCALDIVSLSQPPLHIVPLFRFKNPNKDGSVSQCVPHWCDISFFGESSDFTNHWIPRCKIYELQMMGVMENEVNDAKVPRLSVERDIRSISEAMDRYDLGVFKTNVTKDETSKEETPSLKLPRPVDANATLSLIGSKSVALGTRASTAKFDATTTNSSVLGTVAQGGVEASALNSLYYLNRVPDLKHPLKQAPSVRSMKSVSSKLNLEPVKNLAAKNEKSQHIIPSRPKKTANDVESRQSSPHESLLRSSLEFKGKELAQRRDSGEKFEATENASGRNQPYLSRMERLDYWTEIKNPSQELHFDIVEFLRQSRWKNVFPHGVKRRQINWKSLQAPALLPLTTDSFPTTSQLEEEYTFQLYTVLLNWENLNHIDSNYLLMHEMINLRLRLGFQICYGDHVQQVETARGGNPDKILKYYPQGNCIDTRIYLQLDDQIHRILCDVNGHLHIHLYHKRKNETNHIRLGYHDFRAQDYKPLIRTRYADDFSPSLVNFINTEPPSFNWNQFDQLLAGYDDAMPQEMKRFHRMKFVVMPSDIPKNAYYISNEKLTEEEIRVEGLRKLIALIEKGRVIDSADKQPRGKEEILPEINFYTGNLYDYLSGHIELNEYSGARKLVVKGLNKSTDLVYLAELLQGSNGLNLVDRTWHFTTHPYCFLGSQLVSWLIENLDDIDSREEGTKFGQEMMKNGVFKHVQNRHSFLDGYYLYEFEDGYVDHSSRAASSNKSWFKKKPSTPTESRKSSVSADPKSPHTNSGQENSSEKPPTTKFVLSRCVDFNVDPLNRSFRPEIIKVHYDRVHNPEHCYHIRLQWLNTTARLIDDTITNWSRLCERHGLKLVELPWKEIRTFPKVAPLHSFVDLRLAINPWTEQEFSHEHILQNNKFYYHVFLLKKCDFFLDNRSALFFLKEQVEITYSWGNPSFKYAQYVHKTGSYIVELRDNGDLFLAPNNIHLARLNSILSTMPDSDAHIKYQTLDAQKVMMTFRATCTNSNRLRMIFKEALTAWNEEYSAGTLPVDI